MPARMEVYGYEGHANKYTTLPPGTSPLYMTGLGMFKESGRVGVPVVKLELPEAFRDHLVRRLSECESLRFE